MATIIDGLELGFSAKYLSYLESDKWRKKRQEYFDANGKQCQVCSSTENIDVDHLEYTRLGNERLTDLIGLCRRHHIEITEYRVQRRVRSGEGYRKATEDLFGLKLPRDNKSYTSSPKVRTSNHTPQPSTKGMTTEQAKLVRKQAREANHKEWVSNEWERLLSRTK